MAFLTPDRIRTEHGLVIKEKIIPWGAVWPKKYGSKKKGDPYKADRKLSNGTGKVQWVSIHNTNDIKEAKGTNDAEQYTRACWPNANLGSVRVHYFIDETDCWQNLREDEVGWHAADGDRGPGNDTSLAIEIIMDGSGSKADKAAEDRGALLAAILLNRHGLSIDKLTTHQRWYNKKYCPAYILPHWDDFVGKVAKYMLQIRNTPDKPAKPETSEPAPAKLDPAKSRSSKKAGAYKVTTSGDPLMLRSGASTGKQIIERMPNGSKVQCYGYYTGQWLYVVSASGKTGFCHSGYLKKV